MCPSCLQERDIPSSVNEEHDEIYLDGDGGRKSWDPGAADMVEAPGCQTEGP